MPAASPRSVWRSRLNTPTARLAGLCSVLSLTLLTQRERLGVVAGEVATRAGLSSSEINFVISTGTIVSRAGLIFPSYVCHRYGPARCLYIGVLMCAVACMLFGAALSDVLPSSVFSLSVLNATATLASSFMFMGEISYISQEFHSHDRAGAFLVQAAVIAIGLMLVSSMYSATAHLLGVSGFFFAVAIALTIFGVVALPQLPREPSTVAPEPIAAIPIGLGDDANQCGHGTRSGTRRLNSIYAICIALFVFTSLFALTTLVELPLTLRIFGGAGVALCVVAFFTLNVLWEAAPSLFPPIPGDYRADEDDDENDDVVDAHSHSAQSSASEIARARFHAALSRSGASSPAAASGAPPGLVAVTAGNSTLSGTSTSRAAAALSSRASSSYASTAMTTHEDLLEEEEGLRPASTRRRVKQLTFLGAMSIVFRNKSILILASLRVIIHCIWLAVCSNISLILLAEKPTSEYNGLSLPGLPTDVVNLSLQVFTVKSFAFVIALFSAKYLLRYVSDEAMLVGCSFVFLLGMIVLCLSREVWAFFVAFLLLDAGHGPIPPTVMSLLTDIVTGARFSAVWGAIDTLPCISIPIFAAVILGGMADREADRGASVEIHGRLYCLGPRCFSTSLYMLTALTALNFAATLYMWWHRQVRRTAAQQAPRPTAATTTTTGTSIVAVAEGAASPTDVDHDDEDDDEEDNTASETMNRSTGIPAPRRGVSHDEFRNYLSNSPSAAVSCMASPRLLSLPRVAALLQEQNNHNQNHNQNHHHNQQPTPLHANDPRTPDEEMSPLWQPEAE